MKLSSAALIWMLFPAVLLADGFFMARSGVYVREKEQHAYIEWHNGKETLHLTVQSEGHHEPVVWIIPIPSDPKAVVVEPSSTMPLVYSKEQPIPKAKKSIRSALAAWFGMSSGLIPAGALMIGAGEESVVVPAPIYLNGDSDGIIVHSRVVKLGMVVEVLTAESAQALDRYLQSKEIKTNAKSITALKPYLEKDFTLVCGWPENEKKAMEARSVRVEFPSDDIFYPLLPTSIYEHQIETSIFVKGWVKPANEIELPGLRCIYHEGGTYNLGIDQYISSWKRSADSYKGDALEEYMERTSPFPITEVRISSDPGDWTQDLRLLPMAPAHVTLAALINEYSISLFFLVPAIIGSALGLLFPFTFIPRDKIVAGDFARGAFVGAALSLTVFAASLLCIVWLRRRRPLGSLERIHPVVWYMYGMMFVALLVPAGVWLLVYLEIPVHLIESVSEMVMIAFAFPLLVWPLTHVALHSAVKHRAGWFPVFVAGHYGVLLILGSLVNRFLSSG